MRMRKLMLPPFHGEAIAHYAELIEQITEPRDRRLAAGRDDPHAHGRADDHDGGDHPRGLRDHRSRPDRRAQAPAAAAVLGRTRSCSLMQKDLGPRSPWGRFLAPPRPRRRAALRGDRAAPRASPTREGRDDILTLLLAARDEDGDPLTDRELRDELITLLLAGHETTATSIGWAFERLLRTPRALERLTDEVDGGRERRLHGGGDQGDAARAARRDRGLPRADRADRARRLPGSSRARSSPRRSCWSSTTPSCTRPTRRRSAPSASSTARPSRTRGSRSAAACAAASARRSRSSR